MKNTEQSIKDYAQQENDRVLRGVGLTSLGIIGLMLGLMFTEFELTAQTISIFVWVAVAVGLLIGFGSALTSWGLGENAWARRQLKKPRHAKPRHARP